MSASHLLYTVVTAKMSYFANLVDLDGQRDVEDISWTNSVDARFLLGH